MRSRLLLLAFVLSLTQVAGTCVDTDTAVFVDATIDSPQITVADDTLGATVAGSFLLVLHLGARASGSSEVTYESFSLVDEEDNVIIESLPIEVSQPSPVTVEAGGADTAVTVTIVSEAPLPTEVADQICAGQVAISGILQDSLATTGTTVHSELFSAGGCE